jgi:hypothetical protein
MEANGKGKARVKTEYVPGVCNIGKEERAMRARAGWLGLGVGVIALVAMLLFRLAPAWRLLLILPLAGAAIGFLQNAFHFCVHFGLSGLFNFGAEVGKTDSVEQAEFRKADRSRAFLILGLSLAIGIVLGLGAALAGPLA